MRSNVRSRELMNRCKEDSREKTIEKATEKEKGSECDERIRVALESAL